MNRPRDYHIKWNKLDKEKYHMISLICGIQRKLYKWTYLQKINRLKDIKTKFIVAKGEDWKGYIRNLGLTDAFCCCSVDKSCLTLFLPCGLQNTPGVQNLPVSHHLPEFVCPNSCALNAIQPPHPLLPSSPLAFNLSQHQGLFQWVSSLYQMA